MSHILQELIDKNLISPPSWLSTNLSFLAISGSISYGVAEDTSDYDLCGFCFPPKNHIFPYQTNLYGFDKIEDVFQIFTKHHVFDQQALGGKGREYDFAIYSIVRYFELCLESNPNMIDSLFVPQNCILHSTAVSEMVRDNRKLFLSKQLWSSYKGYSYGMLHKASGKNPEEGSKRKALRDKFGYDPKYLYNVVRLLSECEQIFLEGDLDLQEKGRREHMKAIRRGEVTEAEVREWASAKEKQLEEIYSKSALPSSPDRAKIRELLLRCIEHHYGSLDKYIQQPDWSISALKEIESVLAKNRVNMYAS